MNALSVCKTTFNGPRHLVVLIVAMGLLLSTDSGRALAEDSAEPHDDRDHSSESGDVGPDEHDDELRIQLTPSEMREFGVEVATATEGEISVYISVPGEVQPNGDELAHIVPRYSGIVTEVRAHIGESVQRGDVLAIVESDESLVAYELKTLIDGTIIQKHITLGEAVSRETITYEIANLNSVWIDLTIYQKDLNSVQLQQPVQIFTGHGPAVARGTISYITPVVDEATRTATARVVLPNSNGHWRPGMFVTAKIRVGSGNVRLVVPATAVLTWKEQQIVFLEEDGGFEPRPVRIGRVGDESLEILAGLNPGDRFVSKGGFTLKSQLDKAAFGDGHNH